MLADLNLGGGSIADMLLPAAGVVVLLLAVAGQAPRSPAPPSRRAAVPWAALAVAVWLLLPGMVGTGQFARYVGLRLALLHALPAIPAFASAPVRRVAVIPQAVDLARALRQGDFAAARPATADGRPPHVVILLMESLRADAFARDMPFAVGLARQHIWLRQHLAQSNGTFLARLGLHYALLPVAFRQLVQRGKPQAWHDFLARTYGHRFQRVEANEEGARFPVGPGYELQSYRREEGEGWESTARALADIGRRLAQATGPLLLEGHLYNTHFNYYYPASAARFLPTVPPQLDIFLLDPSMDHVAGLVNRYRNACLFLDGLLAGFFAAAQRAGRLADTVFVLVGDHGESLGEDGNFGHCSAPLLEQYHVPCVIVAPGDRPVAIDTPTEHLDLVPTLGRFVGYTVTGLPGLDALAASKSATVSCDDSTLDRLLVREGGTMSLFDLSGGRPVWSLTTTRDYAIDARPDGLYSASQSEALGRLIDRDRRTLWTRLRQDPAALPPLP